MNRADFIKVTTHAIVRWVERIDGVDLAEVRKTLRTNGPEVADGEIVAHLIRTGTIDANAIIAKLRCEEVRTAVSLGLATVKIGEVTVCLDGMSVVTVLGAGQRPKRYPRGAMKNHRMNQEKSEREYEKRRLKR